MTYEKNKKVDTIFALKKEGKEKSKLVKSKKNNSFYKIFIFFLLVFMFSIFPIRILEGQKNMIAYANESAIKLENVYQSIKNDNYEKAKIDLLNIEKNIKEIDHELKNIGQKNTVLSRFGLLDDKTINYERIFETALLMSKIGSKLVENYGVLNNLNFSNIEKDDNNDLFKTLENLNASLLESEKDFNDLKIIISNINDKKINGKELEYILILKENLEEIENYFNALKEITEKAPDILGKNSEKKYLMLFQNNTEIRATGGFIGTYGILTVKDAKIKNIFIDSIYNPDGQITKKIEPPEPFKKIIDQLFMRDANWYPDFPTSAKQISNLYEIEGGFTPDGIIAFDTKPFIDLIGLTGSINIEKYNTEINQENFISITQFKTSIDYDPKEKNPKKFLGEFALLLLEKIKLLDNEGQKKVMEVFDKNIKQGHIQFYSPDEKIQKVFTNIGFAGEIKKVDKNMDYFNYINTNIGGLKTNLLIEESIEHKIYKNKDNKNIHEVILKRKHNGENGGFSGTNYAYLRFYIPIGSKIISSEGFEKKESIKTKEETKMLYIDQESYPGKAEVKDMDVYEENGKTVIGAWQVIKAGEEIESKITYQLPKNINLDNNYSIFIQKQAGIINQKYRVSVKNKDHFMISKNNDLKQNEDKKYYDFDLNEDRLIEFKIK